MNNLAIGFTLLAICINAAAEIPNMNAVVKSAGDALRMQSQATVAENSANKGVKDLSGSVLSDQEISDILKNSDKPLVIGKYKSRTLVTPVVADKDRMLSSKLGQFFCDGDPSFAGAVGGRKYMLTGVLISPVYQDDDGGKFFSLTGCSVK